MKLRVHVSSTQKEFQNERLNVADLVATDPVLSRHYEVVLFEQLPASPAAFKDVSSNAISAADAFISIIGNQYGAVNEDGLSWSHAEYLQARRLGKPTLVFIKGSTRAQRDPKVSAWISDARKELICRQFSDVASLRQQVSSALVDLLQTLWIKKTPDSRKSKEILQPTEEAGSARVFLVHGRNEEALYKTARFLEKLVPEVIILSEKPSKGKTVIEKFEHYSDVGYAVVLLTGDDKGGLANVPAKKQSLRARQNVIFELGYFIGKIGRDRVCALYSPGVELPSDYSGVVYIFFDENDAWKLRLARELKEFGVPIDPNAIIA